MDEIAKQVRRARRRMLLERLIGRLGWCWLAGLTLALIGVAVSRLVPMPVTAWQWAVGGLALGLLAALVWSIVARPSRLRAAAEIDYRCRLKERVSSALSLSPADRETGPGRAVLTDALARLKRVDVRQHFPVRAGRPLLWPLLPATLLAIVAMLFPPAVAEKPAVAKPEPNVGQRIAREVKVLRRELKRQRQRAKEKNLDELEQLLKKVEQGTASMEKAQLTRRDSLAKLNKLSEELRQQRERVAAEERLRKRLSQLKRTKEGPADKVTESLRENDLDRAMRELEKLAEQLEKSELSDEQRAELAEQLDQMRQQLEQMAQSQRDAIEQLQRQCQQCRAAGQDAQADALQRQLEQLQQSLSSMELSEQMCERLGECRKCLEQGDRQGAARALRGLRGELERLARADEARRLLDEAENRLRQCRDGMCQGRKRGDKPGQGGLKPGTTPGGFEQDPTDPQGEFFDTQVRQQVGPGELTAVGAAEGPNRRGQVAEEVKQQVEQMERGETDPLAGRRLPRHLRDATREYFDTLRQGE